MQALLQEFDLPLRHVFTISRGSITVQETLIVQLRSTRQVRLRRSDDQFVLRRDDREHVGGDRVGAADCRKGSLDDPLALIDTLADKRAAGEVREVRAQRARPGDPRSVGQAAGAPVYKLWGLTTDNIPMSDYTLGIDTPDKMVAKMDEMPGWPIYKIKLGTADDLSIVRELRQHTDALFRVDANCGWTAEQTIEFAPVLKELGVEFIEQPLPPEDVRRRPAGFREGRRCR